MSATSVDSLDRKTNLWLKSLMHYLEVDDRRFAFMALRAVLHALRDRIGPENAVHLGAQLPMLIRGLYYKARRPARASAARGPRRLIDPRPGVSVK